MESHFSVDIYQVVMDVDSNFCLVNSDLLGPDELPNRSDYCAGVIASSLIYGEPEKITSFNQPQELSRRVEGPSLLPIPHHKLSLFVYQYLTVNLSLIRALS